MARSCATRRLAALLAWALLVAALAGGARADAPVTHLRVAPAVSELEVGEIATLQVRVEEVTDLYGYQVYLDYDPDLLQAVNAAGQPASEVELGAFLAADLVLENSIDGAAGRVSVMVSNMGSAPASGSGVLFTLRFKGLARGVAGVRIDTAANRSILADTDGMAIPYTSHNASLYVGVEVPAPGGRLCLPVVVGGAR